MERDPKAYPEESSVTFLGRVKGIVDVGFEGLTQPTRDARRHVRKALSALGASIGRRIEHFTNISDPGFQNELTSLFNIFSYSPFEQPINASVPAQTEEEVSRGLKTYAKNTNFANFASQFTAVMTHGAERGNIQTILASTDEVHRPDRVRLARMVLWTGATAAYFLRSLRPDASDLAEGVLREAILREDMISSGRLRSDEYPSPQQISAAEALAQAVINKLDELPTDGKKAFLHEFAAGRIKSVEDINTALLILPVYHPTRAINRSHAQEIRTELAAQREEAVNQIADNSCYHVAGLIHRQWQEFRRKQSGMPASRMEALDMRNAHDHAISERWDGATSVDMLKVGWEDVPYRVKHEYTSVARKAVKRVLGVTHGNVEEAEKLLRSGWAKTVARDENETVRSWFEAFYVGAVRYLADNGEKADLARLRAISRDVTRYDRFLASHQRRRSQRRS